MLLIVKLNPYHRIITRDVDVPPRCKPLGSKWIFRRKMKADRSIDKYKTRLSIKGYKQKEALIAFTLILL